MSHTLGGPAVFGLWWLYLALVADCAGLEASSKSTVDRSCDAEHKVLQQTGLREIGHGKQIAEKNIGDVKIRKEVRGVHEELKGDEYGLTSVKTCYGQSLETRTQASLRPSHQKLLSSSSGSSTRKLETEINGVISSKNVLGQARQDQNTGAVTTRESIDTNSYDRKNLVFADEKSVTFREDRKGEIENVEKLNMEWLGVVSQFGSSVQYKSCCMLDFRTITKSMEKGQVNASESGTVTEVRIQSVSDSGSVYYKYASKTAANMEHVQVNVSDEGLFIKSFKSGKGYFSKQDEDFILKEEESNSLSLSSHSCQGIAGALGSGLRHYLREGKVDAELGKAVAKGGAYSWGMSIVTQSIERRHAGGGAAAFAFVQAAQQSVAILRDPTKTRGEKVAESGGSAAKAMVVYGALRLSSKRMMVSAASWIVPVVEIASEGVRSILSYYRGEITWARLQSNLTKAVCVAVPTGLGGWGGGAALGTACGGPFGAAVGAVLGGLCGERLGSYLSSNMRKAGEFADSCFTFLVYFFFMNNYAGG